MEIQPEHDVEILTQLSKQSATDKVKSKKKLPAKGEKLTQSKIMKQRLELMEKAAKEDGLQRSLNAFLDLCVTNNLLNRGLATLLHYRNRGKKKSYPKVMDLNLYNIMIKGFAKRVS